MCCFRKPFFKFLSAVAWLLGSLLGCLVGRSVGCLVAKLVGCLAAWLMVGLVDWLLGRLVACLAGTVPLRFLWLLASLLLQAKLFKQSFPGNAL